MRVSDRYHIDEDEQISERWAMIAILHRFSHLELDILSNLKFVVDPSIEPFPVFLGGAGT